MLGVFPNITVPQWLTSNDKKVLLTILLAEAGFFRVNEFHRHRLLYLLSQSYPSFFDETGVTQTKIADYVRYLLRVSDTNADGIYTGFVQLARQCGLWEILRPEEPKLLQEVMARSYHGRISQRDWYDILDQFEVRRLTDITYYQKRLSERDVQIIIVREVHVRTMAGASNSQRAHSAADKTLSYFRKLNKDGLTGEEKSELRHLIFTENQRLVPYVLSKMKGSNKQSPVRDYEDDLQTGYMALLSAIDRFDVERGLRFSTYAVQCIRGSILRHRNRYRFFQHVPENQNLLLQRAIRLKNEKEIELGREIKLSEWAEFLAVSPAQLQPLVQAHQEPLRFSEAPFGDSANDDGSWINQVPDEVDVEEEVTRRATIRQICEVLNGLGGREGDFLRMRMGIYESRKVWEDACKRLGRIVQPGEAVSVQEIANAYQVSKDRVRQTTGLAVGKLRESVTAAVLVENFQ